MISYEFTQSIPKKHNDSNAYAEELKIIQTFLETAQFPVLKLSYPNEQKCYNAGTFFRRRIRTCRLSLAVTTRGSDVYLTKNNTESKGE